MEAKTIGKFITALRKANGMTQKDLAEKLNISDKTISRWERDEGNPDLSMIPILAEIFDVTCDELLRGERKSPVQREAEKVAEYPSAINSEDLSAKGEKQRQRLLKSTFSQYQSRTYIAIGLSAVGIIVALICNLVFLRASLGFLLGAIFFVAGIVCQVIFKNRAFLSVEDSGLENADLFPFQRNVIRLAQKSIGLTIACIGFTFPLVFADAYVGLAANSMLRFGLIGILVFLALYAVILYFYNASLVKRGSYPMTEQETSMYHRNHLRKGKCAAVLLLLLFITFSIQKLVAYPDRLIKGTTFEDYESFIAFMEQDDPNEYRFSNNVLTIEQVVPNSTVYYDENGNTTSAEQALHCTLQDKNGTIVCEYTFRNNSVSSMNYTPKDGTVLPITVYTHEDWANAHWAARNCGLLFFPLYAAEVAAVIWLYFKKKEK